MDDRTLTALARSAVFRAVARLGAELSREDREDCLQEAAAAIVACSRLRPDCGNGYLVATGANAVITWLTRVWWTPRPLPLTGNETAEIHLTLAVEHLDAAIAALTHAGRVHGGQRAADAMDTERAILELRVSGWSESAIAAELQMTKSAIHQALRRLRQRIRS